MQYNVFSGVVEEKAAACKAVASFAHHCPVAFVPYLNHFVEKIGAVGPGTNSSKSFSQILYLPGDDSYFLLPSLHLKPFLS